MSSVRMCGRHAGPALAGSEGDCDGANPRHHGTRSMILRLFSMLLLLATVFGGIFGWKYQQAQEMAAQAAQPPRPATVPSAEVSVESWQPYLRAVGSLTAISDVAVTSEVAGKVAKIHFESGQRVEKGDLLLELDDEVDRAELRGLMADLKLAEVQHGRSRKLLKEDTISQSEFDTARARLESARAQVAQQRALINKKNITAAFSGYLGIRQVDLGEYLSPGSTIVSLQTLDPIHADFSLPERHFAQLEVGQTVRITVQPYPDEGFEGAITALNPGVDPGTRSVRVRATLKNPQAKLRPGMFAEIRTLLPEREDILTLPRTAITYNPYGDSVFIIQQKDQQLVVQRKQVTTGETRDGRVEIRSGLEARERVAAGGQNKLRNGQPVTIDNSVSLTEAPAGP